MGLRDIESTLPPGFRFYPNDEELVCHYLYKKITNEKISHGTMVEVDLHTCEPWELPEDAKLSPNEWYFFSFRDRKYATGSRSNRATKTGYWKATGKDRLINKPRTNNIVGMRKTLVFYGGRAPAGIKTGWVMHEFRLDSPHSPPKEDWVLCRVFCKRKGEKEAGHDNFNGFSSHKPTSSSLDQPMMVDECYDQMGSLHCTVPLQESCSSNNLTNIELLQCNFLNFAPETICDTPITNDTIYSQADNNEFSFFHDDGFTQCHLHGARNAFYNL